MSLDPKNGLLKEAIVNTFWNDFTIGLKCNDYDRCSFEVFKDIERKTLSVSMTCLNFKEIFEIGGEFMVSKYYPNLTLEKKPKEGHNLTLTLDLKKFDSIEGLSGAELQKVKARNEEIINNEADKLALLRRNFYASPFEVAFEGVKSGKPTKKCKYSQREKETTFILPDKDQVTVFFGINFDDPVDKQIAKLILYELEEAKRQVKNAPQVSKMFEDKVPESLVQEFPELKNVKLNLSNGLIGITLFKAHIVPNYEKAASFLQGFRQYIHYHIHSSKTYLHGRLRKRLAALQKTIHQAKFETESVLVYKTAKGEDEEIRENEEEETGDIMRKK